MVTPNWLSGLWSQAHGFVHHSDGRTGDRTDSIPAHRKVPLLDLEAKNMLLINGMGNDWLLRE